MVGGFDNEATAESCYVSGGANNVATGQRIAEVIAFSMSGGME